MKGIKPFFGQVLRIRPKSFIKLRVEKQFREPVNSPARTCAIHKAIPICFCQKRMCSQMCIQNYRKILKMARRKFGDVGQKIRPNRFFGWNSLRKVFALFLAKKKVIFKKDLPNLFRKTPQQPSAIVVMVKEAKIMGSGKKFSVKIDTKSGQV